ncbi:CPK4 [Symbiodinium natans]|uniref:CPK4 protein n=1 Tax=Symbiodinium natans TaxID=878477 RepID=A0A812N3A4_9DINO|nr:CPK4 [Symbiodinium natans]
MKRNNSMTRLPDEAPIVVGEKGYSCDSPPAARPGSASSASARKQGGLLTLPIDTASSQQSSGYTPGNTPTRSGSKKSGSTTPSSGNMMRLPDEPASAVPTLQAPEATTTASGGGGGGMQRIRDRLSKNLSVATPVKPPEQQKSKMEKIFRTLKPGESINNTYIFEEEIYSGGCKGRVLVAKRKTDGQEVVVKIRAKQANRANERNWRTIMAQMHGISTSDNVLGFSEIVEGENEFYVIMPKCNGGELFEFLANETEVPEAECKRIIREILGAVGHLHKNNIIHRDIKPENIMFDLDLMVESSPKTVKLIDFDTCQEWTPQTPKSRRFVGTPGYIAPEALMGQQSPQSDLWSVGVILYILMTGEMPWSSLVSLEDGLVGSPSATQMYRALKAEILEWEQEPWPDFPLARDLCQKLLAFELDDRMKDCEEALSHAWLKE